MSSVVSVWNVKDIFKRCFHNFVNASWRLRHLDGQLHGQVSISSKFHTCLLRVQIQKAQKIQSSHQSFLRFWGLRAKKLCVKCWSNWLKGSEGGSRHSRGLTGRRPLVGRQQDQSLGLRFSQTISKSESSCRSPERPESFVQIRRRLPAFLLLSPRGLERQSVACSTPIRLCRWQLHQHLTSSSLLQKYFFLIHFTVQSLQAFKNRSQSYQTFLFFNCKQCCC
jgi:hypothetical protein